MNVKSLIASRQNGDSEALKTLDMLVQRELGTDITIHMIQDTLYGNARIELPLRNFIAVRVVVYTNKINPLD